MKSMIKLNIIKKIILKILTLLDGFLKILILKKFCKNNNLYQNY